MTYNINTDGPEVITFPSVIFATFLIVGLVTDRALIHTLEFYGYPHPGGWSFIILGILLFCWSSAHFIKAKTFIDIRKPATKLITRGPYKISRNPMYLSNTLIYLGISIVFGQTVTLVCILPCLFVLHYYAIVKEEQYLELKFGNIYLSYRQRVRRWV